jgi:hypothetical protein
LISDVKSLSLTLLFKAALGTPGANKQGNIPHEGALA